MNKRKKEYIYSCQAPVILAAWEAEIQRTTV
jgi:hypothetical protein